MSSTSTLLAFFFSLHAFFILPASGQSLRSQNGVGNNRHLLGVNCEHTFYSTHIGMSSEESIQCTDEEIVAIGDVLDTAYDEVLSLDPALSGVEIDIQTTVCPDTTVVTARRDLGTAVTKQWAYSWKGGGKCRLCSTDNVDRRRALVSSENGLDRVLAVDAYEVIDFSVNGGGKPIKPNTYVKGQWASSHGMTVLALPHSGGYAPDKKARILDSSNPGTETNLGSPNFNCAGGGPGIGIGGYPYEKGENCVHQGNVLIIQSNNNTTAAAATASTGYGVIVFQFKSPTRIGHIGVMGVKNGTTSIVNVLTSDGEQIEISYEGLGDNSVQQVHIGLSVRNVRVVLIGSAAVTEIGVFTPRTAQEALSYRSGESYTRNVSLFDEYVPYLEFDLSYYLTRKVNNVFGSINGGCLENSWVHIDVTLEKVTEIPVIPELNCSTVWTMCPTEKSSKIFEYSCTQGLNCSIISKSNYTNRGMRFWETTDEACVCGPDSKFACTITNRGISALGEPLVRGSTCPQSPPYNPNSFICLATFECAYPFQVNCNCTINGGLRCNH